MIYIGIPAHDEQHTIGVVMWSIRKVLLEEDLDFEILVVDDASTDETAAVLEPYDRVLPLTIHRHEERRGYRACLEWIVREALERSDYHRRDALLTLHADFTHPPAAIPDFLRHFQSGTDLVAGAPTERREPPRQVTWARKGLSALAPVLSLPELVRDPFCAFRLYRLFVLERALSSAEGPLLRHGGWAADAELLYRVWPHARRVEEVEFALDYTRRYRPSRFDLLPEMVRLWRVARDRDLHPLPAGPEGGNGAPPPPSGG